MSEISKDPVKEATQAIGDGLFNVQRDMESGARNKLSEDFVQLFDALTKANTSPESTQIANSVSKLNVTGMLAVNEFSDGHKELVFDSPFKSKIHEALQTQSSDRSFPVRPADSNDNGINRSTDSSSPVSPMDSNDNGINRSTDSSSPVRPKDSNDNGINRSTDSSDSK